jgi:hypothetical protein
MLKVVDMSLVNEGFFESYCPTFMELLWGSLKEVVDWLVLNKKKIISLLIPVFSDDSAEYILVFPPLPISPSIAKIYKNQKFNLIVSLWKYFFFCLFSL